MNKDENGFFLITLQLNFNSYYISLTKWRENRNYKSLSNLILGS